MSEVVQASIPVNNQSDILRARSAGREIARASGFGTVDQTRLATAISELARNTLLYARDGLCTIYVSSSDDGKRVLRVVVSDQGPGIDDVALALKPGFSGGAGLGQGLPAVRRLMDSLDIDSKPGSTIVETKMSRRV